MNNGRLDPVFSVYTAYIYNIKKTMDLKQHWIVENALYSHLYTVPLCYIFLSLLCGPLCRAFAPKAEGRWFDEFRSSQRLKNLHLWFRARAWLVDPLSV